MPTYDILSIKTLETCRKTLKDLSVLARHNSLVMRYFIVLLYEYCVCYVYFALYPKKEHYNVKITLKHLQKYSTQKLCNEAVNHVCLLFFNARNKFAHITNALFEDTILFELLYDDIFRELVTIFELPEEVIQVIINYENSSLNNTFNPHDYLRSILGDKVDLLPEASVNECDSIDACNELLDSLIHML